MIVEKGKTKVKQRQTQDCVNKINQSIAFKGANTPTKVGEKPVGLEILVGFLMKTNHHHLVPPNNHRKDRKIICKPYISENMAT